MSKETLTQELARFTKVMDARPEFDRLIDLFNRVASSSKFSEDAKPHCFGLLIQRCGQRLPNDKLTAAMDSILFTGAAETVRNASLTEEKIEEYLAPMVVRLFKAVPKIPSAVGNLFYFTEKCMLSAKRTDTFNYMFASGMTEDEVGHLCDLNREDAKRFKSKWSVENSPFEGLEAVEH